MPKYEFLSPWWRVLTAYDLQFVADRRSSDYNDPNRIGGLSVHVPPQRPRHCDGDLHISTIRDKCEELRDALELVFLLSVVDLTAFVEMAGGHLCRRTWSQQEIEHALGARCRVELHGSHPHVTPIRETHEWMRIAMETMLTPQRLQNRAQCFQDAHHKLVSVASRPPRRFEISVRVKMDNAIVPILSSLFRGRSHMPEVDGYPFQECVVDVKSVLDPVCLAQLDACLRHTGRCRLRLGSVSIPIDRRTEQVAYGHLLSVLLRPFVERVPTTAAPTTPGASVEAATPATLPFLQQLCSALMHCQGIDSLTTSWVCAAGDYSYSAASCTSRQLMQWIAVALFSPWANHSIRHVHLRRFRLSSDECDELRQLFQLSDPIASLLGQPPVEPNGRGHQVLVAKHPGTTHHLTCVRLSETSWLDVVVDDKRDVEHCCVLVPAYGVCRLKRVDSRAQRPRALPQPMSRVTSLTLDVFHAYAVTDLDTDRQNGLCGFLALVGAPLTTLSVTRAYNFASCLDAVWVHCPVLQCLRLDSVPSTILAVLVDAYETGDCRVTSLDLRNVRDKPNGTDVDQFFRVLADTTRPITQTLWELSLGLDRVCGHFQLTRELAQAANEMLEANTTLSSFVVGLALSDNSDFVAVCKRHHGQRLPERKTRLQARAKLAFLSVVAFGASSAAVGISESSLPLQARTQLDSDVLIHIFDMAAQSITRKVEIVWGGVL